MAFNTARRGRKVAFFENADYGVLSKQQYVRLCTWMTFDYTAWAKDVRFRLRKTSTHPIIGKAQSITLMTLTDIAIRWP
jgi:hypothetical protein